jgi:hypothetical protein
MDLREIGWEGVERIHLAKDRDWRQALVNMVMNISLGSGTMELVS